MDVDVAGELGLQAFMMAQLHAPLGLLTIAAGLLNALLKRPEDARRRMEAISVGWQMGHRARPLFGVDGSKRWGQPISEVRAAFQLIPVLRPEAGGQRQAA